MAKRGKWNGGNMEQNKMVNNLDDLAEFEDFQRSILPKLRTAIKQGKSPDAIFNMVKSAAAGKLATLAIITQDNKEALALCAQILDRSEGKAKERVDITSRYEKLSDEEIEAQLLQREKDLGLDKELDS